MSKTIKGQVLTDGLSNAFDAVISEINKCVVSSGKYRKSYPIEVEKHGDVWWLKEKLIADINCGSHEIHVTFYTDDVFILATILEGGLRIGDTATVEVNTIGSSSFNP